MQNEMDYLWIVINSSLDEDDELRIKPSEIVSKGRHISTNSYNITVNVHAYGYDESSESAFVRANLN
jgi:hypothetical protein